MGGGGWEKRWRRQRNDLVAQVRQSGAVLVASAARDVVVGEHDGARAADGARGHRHLQAERRGVDGASGAAAGQLPAGQHHRRGRPQSRRHHRPVAHVDAPAHHLPHPSGRPSIARPSTS